MSLDQQQQPQDNAQAAIEPEAASTTSRLKAVWDAVRPSRALIMGAGAVILTGATTIHFYNNEEQVLSTVLKDPEIIIHPIDENSSLIQQGDSLAIRYKGLVCPVAINWPENTKLSLGNTGDASFSPVDESTISTILGTLGVTRNVTIDRQLDPNAEGLMRDFYNHAEQCNAKIATLIERDGATAPVIPTIEP